MGKVFVAIIISRRKNQICTSDSMVNNIKDLNLNYNQYNKNQSINFMSSKYNHHLLKVKGPKVEVRL